MTNRIPAVLTGQALRSLRDSGYSLPAALAEVIDNSLEAKANSIRIRLEESMDRKKRHIHRISIVDDGTGMDSFVLQRYPQIGFSTRYMSKDTIGKYGVGAKFAALNYSERLDVWSRTDVAAPWQHVYFDLEEAENQEAAGVEAGIDEPDTAAVPAELQDLLPESTGTLVVWSKVDRLEEGRFADDANTLRVEIEKELARTFRYFLDGGITIAVNDTQLRPHDPLYLMEETWADAVLGKYYRRKDVDPQFPSQDHYPATLVADEQLKFRGSDVRLRVTVYPEAVIRKRGVGADKLATELGVPDNLGALSFIRLDREINYTNVPRILPLGVQEQDRYIGIEVSFLPVLDEFMGVRNVKRGVEPHGELRVLLRKQLERWIPQARDIIQDIWGEVSRATQDEGGEHAEILDAVAKAERTLPKGRSKGPGKDEEEKILKDLAKDVHRDDENAQEEYLKRIANLPYVLETVDFPGSNFMDVKHLSHQIVVRLNERHPFYQQLWLPIKNIANAPAGSVSGDEATRTASRTLEALTLLVIAYAKAESMDAEPSKFEELRDDWGKFLRSLMGKIKGVR